MLNIECCVPLNFVCIEKKIYWFSFIYTMVNCSVWLECCTCDIHTLPSGLTYSAVGHGKCDQQLVSQWSVTVEWSRIMGSYSPPQSVVRDRKRM